MTLEISVYCLIKTIPKLISAGLYTFGLFQNVTQVDTVETEAVYLIQEDNRVRE